MSLPVMVRPNSVLAIGSDETRPDYDYADGVTFHVFEPADGAECTASLVTVDGQEGTSAAVRRDEDVVRITRKGGRKPWGVCLRNVTGVKGVEGGSAEQRAEGTFITPAKGAETIVVKM
jgi:alpha-D-xyloside xylohydrolase